MSSPGFYELMIFCEKARSRKEIKENFNLSAVESYHCVKRFGKYTQDVITTVYREKAGNPRVFIARKIPLDEIKLMLKRGEISL